MSVLEQMLDEAPPAWPGLWGRDAEGAYLIAGRCTHCSGLALGLREFCPHCQREGTLREARVGRTGRLYTATVIHQGPSGFKAPYRIGYVDIEGGIRVFAHLDNGAAGPRIGDAVTLDVQPLATDKAGKPMTVPIYARACRGTGIMRLRRAGIMGVGLTPFDKHDGVSIETLTQRAIVAALADAGVALKDLQAVYAAHLYQGEVFGQRVLRGLRAPPLQIVNVENACAGGSTAFRAAWLSVATEENDLVLVVGAEKMDRGLINFVGADLELTLGNTAPAQYALSGQRHMHEFGTTPEDFAAVAVKSRLHGALNPNARIREKVTLEEVLGSRPIAEPLTLLQCCRNGSGAAAVVIGSEEHCRRRSGPKVWIEGSGLRAWMGDANARDLTSFGATAVAAQAAYESSGIGPDDVNVVELHDAFTVGELMHYEGLGLCAKGDGRRLVREQATTLGGRVPVNVSGGLLSKSHPVGATGVAQFAELTWQLRGEASGRQVENARIALAHSQGGTGLEAGATCVTLLSRGQ